MKSEIRNKPLKFWAEGQGKSRPKGPSTLWKSYSAERVLWNWISHRPSGLSSGAATNSLSMNRRGSDLMSWHLSIWPISSSSFANAELPPCRLLPLPMQKRQAYLKSWPGCLWIWDLARNTFRNVMWPLPDLRISSFSSILNELARVAWYLTRKPQFEHFQYWKQPPSLLSTCLSTLLSSACSRTPVFLPLLRSFAELQRLSRPLCDENGRSQSLKTCDSRLFKDQMFIIGGKTSSRSGLLICKRSGLYSGSRWSSFEASKLVLIREWRALITMTIMSVSGLEIAL